MAVLFGQYVLNYHLIYYICGVSSYVLVFSVPIIVCIKFSKRLFKQAVSIRASQLRNVAETMGTRIQSFSFGSRATHETIILTEKQGMLLKVIAKQTLLIFFESFTMCVGALLLIGGYIVWYILDDQATYWYCYPFGIFLFCIDNIIITFCVWFSFIFNEPRYQTFCKKCHTQFLKCYQDKARYELHSLSMRPDYDNSAMAGMRYNTSYVGSDYTIPSHREMSTQTHSLTVSGKHSKFGSNSNGVEIASVSLNSNSGYKRMEDN